jgi:hypothetical protein
MSNHPHNKSAYRPAQPQLVLCLLCATRAKTAVESGAIDPYQAQVNAAVTWAPISTGNGMPAVVPVCTSCIPPIDIVKPNAIDTRTKLSDAAMKAGHNGQ